MDTVTITASASVTLDGRIINRSGTFTCEVTHIIEQTISVDATYVPAIQADANDVPVFHLVVNTGDNDAIIRFEVATGPSVYAFFSVPAGGHVLIPGAGGETQGTSPQFSPFFARSVGAGTRLFIMTGVVG